MAAEAPAKPAPPLPDLRQALDAGSSRRSVRRAARTSIFNRWLSDAYRIPTSEAPEEASKEDDEEP